MAVEMRSSPFDLTQAMSALEVANERRIAAADLKREMKAGLPFVEAISDPRAAVIPIGALLGAMPGMGPTRAMRVLAPLHLSATRRVRDLSDRQKELVIDTMLNRRTKCLGCGVRLRKSASFLALCNFCAEEQTHA